MMKLSASSPLISEMKYLKYFIKSLTIWVRTQPQHDSSGQYNEAFRILIRPSRSGNPLTEEAVAAVEVIGRFLLFQLNFKSILTPQRGEKWSLCAGFGGVGGGITASRSADGFSSIIWSLLLAFKQDVLSLTEIGGWRTTFLPPLCFEAMRVTFSPPWVRLGCHALSSGHKKRKSKQRPLAVHFITAGSDWQMPGSCL